MTTRRLRWRGPAQQQRIQQELERQLALWLQGWSVEGPWLSIAQDDTAAIASERRWLRAHGKAGTTWVGLASNAPARLGERLARVSPTDRSDLSERIGLRALRALLAQLMNTTAELLELDETAPAPADLQARFGGQRWQLTGAEFAASLVLDSETCDRIAPPIPAAAIKLEPRASALGAEQVSLRVQLNLGETTLQEAHALQVGDVLVSSTRLDALFHMIDADSRPLASGRLRRHDRRLAFALQGGTPTTTRRQA
jgi:hypothetical protein